MESAPALFSRIWESKSDISQPVFHGNFNIAFYGIIIAIAMVTAVLVILKLPEKRIRAKTIILISPL